MSNRSTMLTNHGSAMLTNHGKFLQRVASELLTEYRERLDKSLVLVPNKRAKTFLLEYMREAIDTPLVAPRCLSFGEYASSLSGMRQEKQIPLLFRLYEVYNSESQIKGEKSLSFEEFYFLGNTLLRDFDEIDLALVDDDRLFSDLKRLREYEEGAPTLAAPLVKMWSMLGEVYKKFLLLCKEKKSGHRGFVYRQAAEICQKKEKLLEEGGFVFWVGFSSLSGAEEAILRKTQADEQAHIYLDIDRYFTDDEHQEAGEFYRRFWVKGDDNEVRWKDDLLSQRGAKVEVLSTANETAMVKLLGEKVREYATGTRRRPDEVAIILPKEQLLFSVLNALPEGISSINVTMGFPLLATQIATWVEILFRLHETLIVPLKEGEVSFSGKAFLEVLDHQYTRLLSDNDVDVNRLIVLIRKENLTRLRRIDMEDEHGEIRLPRQIEDWVSMSAKDVRGEKVVSLLFGMVKNLLEAYRKRGLSFDSEFIYGFLGKLDEIQHLIDEKKDKYTLNFVAVTRLVRDMLGDSVIAFSGEPLEGWQVMGVLETQALDFDTVFVLSMNEGSMPSQRSRVSFLPSDKRAEFGLPSYSERESNYAYYFYRLLKRAQNVFLFYTKEAGDGGEQEKSRYVEQILLEYMPGKTGVQHWSYPVVLNKKQGISVAKNDAILAKLRGHKYSSTSIKTYFRCSLRFYYQYVLGVRDMDDLEESPAAQDVGKIIHTVLQSIFVAGNVKRKDLYDACEDTNLSELVKSAIQKDFSKQPIEGRLALVRYTVEKQIKHLVKTQMDWVPFFVCFVEETLAGKVVLNDGTTLCLYGTPDRLDERNGALMLIDYKTGQTQTLTLSSDEEMKKLYENRKREYLFQLCFYGYLIRQNWQKKWGEKDLSLGVFSLRDNTFSEAVFRNNENGKKTSFDESCKNLFEEGLREAFGRILSFEAFVQTEDTNTCKTCPFSMMCGR